LRSLVTLALFLIRKFEWFEAFNVLMLLGSWALFDFLMIVSRIREQNLIAGRVCSKYCCFGLAQLISMMFDLFVRVLFKHETR